VYPGYNAQQGKQYQHNPIDNHIQFNLRGEPFGGMHNKQGEKEFDGGEGYDKHHGLFEAAVDGYFNKGKVDIARRDIAEGICYYTDEEC